MSYQYSPLISNRVFALWTIYGFVWIMAMAMANSGSTLGSFLLIILVLSLSYLASSFGATDLESFTYSGSVAAIGTVILFGALGLKLRQQWLIALCGLVGISLAGLFLVTVLLAGNFNENWP